MKYSLRFVRFVRDFVLTLVVVAGMYAFAFSPVVPLNLPGYLLIGGFDRLEVAFGPALGLGWHYTSAFALYLVVLAALGAAVAAVVRALLGGDGWADGIAGVLVLLGVLVLSLAASAFVQGGISPVPLAIITATGLVLVGVGLAAALVARNYRLELSLSKQTE